MKRDAKIVADTEKFFTSYVAFSESYHPLVAALWTMATHCWPSFDAFPYLVITAAEKRCGKSRLMELLQFTSANSQNMAAVTASAIYGMIANNKPTLFCDEAEKLVSESASLLRTILNVGYRRGQVVVRKVGNDYKEYETYCPKCFILIGDVNDTLRDRSIILTMKRGEAKNRFTFEQGSATGKALRSVIHSEIGEHEAEISAAYQNHKGLDFLTDRDEEIWTPLFVLCEIFCPSRMEELTIAAVDMATEKTAEARSYVQLLGKTDSQKNEQSEYTERLIRDLYTLLKGEKAIKTSDALEMLKALPTSPWRKFKGEGLTAHSLSAMLDVYGVSPKTIRFSNGEKGLAKGYERKMVETQMKKFGVKA